MLKPQSKTICLSVFQRQQPLLPLPILNRVKHRALYCDTDPCIFVAGENDEVPKTGNFLGELTDEILNYGMELVENLLNAKAQYYMPLE